MINKSVGSPFGKPGGLLEDERPLGKPGRFVPVGTPLGNPGGLPS